MRTAELTGRALDWAVAKCVHPNTPMQWWERYSEYWEVGGPIIEREFIALSVDVTPDRSTTWFAENNKPYTNVAEESGPTPLVAAMRCYVASVLGDDVDIPKELLR